VFIFDPVVDLFRRRLSETLCGCGTTPSGLPRHHVRRFRIDDPKIQVGLQKARENLILLKLPLRSWISWRRETF
jgi:hypothetical protein